MNEIPDYWITFWEPFALNSTTVLGYCVKDDEVTDLLVEGNTYTDDPKLIKEFVEKYQPNLHKKRRRREKASK